ncbi:MAG TPA: heavy metal-binding domain-containing protein [Actinocrinis sp.]|nr:heavy metal-binding domain-containing protein [Actinocrinis sp.]
MTQQQADGSLPAAARARMAEIGSSHTWGSALSTQEFAAVKGAGFDPVGQVLGTAVFQIGYTGGWGCSGAWSYYGGGVGAQVSSSAWAPFSALVKTMYAARRLAISRAVAECQSLGGDGIVGADLKVRRFPAGGLEFTMIGTAVRAHGNVRPTKPFTSHVGGQDFAKLIHAGYVPTSLVLGISIATRHDDWLTMGQNRWNAGNQEISGYTQLVNHARHDARTQLANDVKAHRADGVVVDEVDLNISERECPAQQGRRDHIAEAVFLGTAISRFDKKPRSNVPKPLTIMSLDPERRRSARLG